MIRVGDKFIFNGLPGQNLEDREIEIISISVDGKVAFTITFLDEELNSRFSNSLHSILLSELLLLIEKKVWWSLSSRLC